MRTDEGRLGDLGCQVVCYLDLDGDLQQFAYVCEIAFSPGIGKQPIVANAVKAARQHVQQEAAHELGR